jgi:hypothetical protein
MVLFSLFARDGAGGAIRFSIDGKHDSQPADVFTGRGGVQEKR